MSWTQFKAEVRTRGLARTNRYRAIIPVPVSNLGSADKQLISLFCDSVSLPGINLSTTPQRVFGEVREMPYEKIYDPVQMTFLVDSQMVIKSAFDSWIGMVINPNRRTVQYYDTYTTTIELYVVTVDQQEPYRITLYEAYPKSLGSIAMGAENREVMRLPVTFQYKYWKAESVKLKASQIITQSMPSVNSQGVLVPPSLPVLFGPLYT